jgi:hypothetical protein
MRWWGRLYRLQRQLPFRGAHSNTHRFTHADACAFADAFAFADARTSYVEQFAGIARHNRDWHWSDPAVHRDRQIF